eukprot:1754543-Amphidinium_carterae.1
MSGRLPPRLVWFGGLLFHSWTCCVQTNRTRVKYADLHKHARQELAKKAHTESRVLSQEAMRCGALAYRRHLPDHLEQRRLLSLCKCNTMQRGRHIGEKRPEMIIAS